MTTPTVSICLPNLNTATYLEECIRSALGQTFSDFELIISDNYSDDGSWEIIQRYAGEDKRTRAFQKPREGMYANWNNTLREARGKYIYILTSDDVMVPDCLEKMVAALEAHPECDIATCKLLTIDEFGNPIPEQWERYDSTRYLGEILEKQHVRFAPSDFPIHFLFGSIIISITQILVRRTVFDRVGMFRTDLGSEADLEWHARSSWFSSKIHIPEFLATWRRSPQQATGQGKREGAFHYRRLWRITRPALKEIQMREPTAQCIDAIRWALPYQYNEFTQCIHGSRGAFEMCLTLFRGMTHTPLGMLEYFLRYFRTINNISGDNLEWVEDAQRRLGIQDEIQLQDGTRCSLDLREAFSRYLRIKKLNTGMIKQT